jgi:signal transduction histidine kinase
VRIYLDKEHLCLDIIDDGCGIAAGQPAGVGLNAMQERTAELGGQFTIRQSAAGGTCVRASLPAYADRKM